MGTTMLSIPTPQPDTKRPKTMTRYPLQKVWKTPPMEKRKAPVRIVQRRPYLSARWAARSEVTLISVSTHTEPTEGSNLQDGNHAVCQWGVRQHPAYFPSCVAVG